MNKNQNDDQTEAQIVEDSTTQQKKAQKTTQQTKKKIAKMLIAAAIIFIILGLAGIIIPKAQESITPKWDKPIIYLYPIEETEITVKLENSEKLTHTYPKYNNEWRVLAMPNGDLVDLKNGRNLYSLYWEGINSKSINMSEGFIVEGKDTITFLEDKLEVLGLSEREANEFIIYWLPKLENNKYNFIRFQTIEELNANMPLSIFPTPNTIIRIGMEFKGLDKRLNIKEQKLTTPIREGFVVVEWGGTEYK